MASVTFPYCANNYGQSCFGREVGEFESMDDFLETVSASKRKNIRRNQRAAQKEMDKHGIVVTMHPAGTWRFTTEFFALIGHQGSRHQEKFHGYPNVVHCNQPVSPFLVMFTEFLFILVFACDLQVFRTKEGKLISFNTRVHVGNCYFNPNYGCYEEYSKYGIYAWTNWDTMAEAIRLRATVANFMPSMKEAKNKLGLRKLRFLAIQAACFSLTSAVALKKPTKEQEQAASEEAAKGKEPKGGKRAARKKAAAEAAAAGQPVEADDVSPTEKKAKAKAGASKKDAEANDSAPAEKKAKAKGKAKAEAKAKAGGVKKEQGEAPAKGKGKKATDPSAQENGETPAKAGKHAKEAEVSEPIVVKKTSFAQSPPSPASVHSSATEVTTASGTETSVSETVTTSAGSQTGSQAESVPSR